MNYYKASVYKNKGQSNLAKGDITRFIMTSGTAHSCLVVIFYHIFARWQHATRSLSWCLHLKLPFWGMAWLSDGTIQKSDGVFLYALYVICLSGRSSHFGIVSELRKTSSKLFHPKLRFFRNWIMFRNSDGVEGVGCDTPHKTCHVASLIQQSWCRNTDS